MDKFILEYLRSKGFEKSLLEFKAEQDEMNEKKRNEEEGRNATTSPFGEIADIVRCLYRSGESQTVDVDHYMKFRSWINGSLDIVKPELEALLFPVFVRGYIRMIVEKKQELAAQFFQLASVDFVGHRGDEIRSLSKLTDASQLKSHPFLLANSFVRHATSKHFEMRMSSVAFELLKNFLMQHQMLSLIYAISKVEIDIQDMATTNSDCVALLEGYNSYPSDNSAIAEPVQWGVPGQGPYHVQGLDASTILPDTKDKYFQNIIEKIVLPNMILRSEEGEGDGGGAEDKGDAVVESSVLEPSVAFVTITDTANSMTCMDISRNAKQVVAGFTDSLVRVWSHHPHMCSPRVMEEGQEIEGGNGYKRIRYAGAMDDVLPKPAGGRGCAARVSEGDLDEGDVDMDPASFPRALELVGHSRRIYDVTQDDYSTEGRLVLSASADETVRLWDTHHGQCVSKMTCTEGVPWVISMSPMGYYYVTGNQLGSATLFSVDSWRTLRVFRGHRSDVTCCTWHPNMAYVATGSGDKCVRLWDVRSGASVRSFSPQTARASILAATLPEGSENAVSMAALSEVTSLSCSPCGSMIAAGYEDGMIALWDVPSSKLTALLSANEGKERSKKPPRSGNKKGASTSTRALQAPAQVGLPGTSPVYSLSFSEDGTGLVSGGSRGVVDVWNVAPASRWSNSNGTEPANPLFIVPHRSFYTKQTAVYSVMYGAGHAVFAGGAFAAKKY